MQSAAETPVSLFPVIMPLVGVVIGGLLTFGIQNTFRYFDRRRSRRERLNRVHMFTVFVIGEILQLHRHVTRGIPANPTRPLWTYVIPLVGNNPAHLTYDFDSLGVLGGRRNSPVLTSLYLLSLERNALVVTLHRYNERRNDLTEALAPYTVVAVDDTATFTDYRRDVAVRRIEVEVESLARALKNDLTEISQRIYELEPTYNAAMRELHEGKGEPNRLVLRER